MLGGDSGGMTLLPAAIHASLARQGASPGERPGTHRALSENKLGPSGCTCVAGVIRFREQWAERYVFFEMREDKLLVVLLIRLMRS